MNSLLPGKAPRKNSVPICVLAPDLELEMPCLRLKLPAATVFRVTMVPSLRLAKIRARERSADSMPRVEASKCYTAWSTMNGHPARS